LSLELVVRTVVVVLLLKAGYAVSGAMRAVFAGLAFVFCLGLFSLRDHFRRQPARVRLRVMAGFSLTAAAGIIGVQILYNQDVILAEHYLSLHDGGIYGGLNKIGTILYFLTLSVSQVLFPRVVEAVAKGHHPGRILLSSAGILAALGAGALLVFAVAPGLVVGILFGPSFRDAIPLVFPVGVIGLALSLDFLLGTRTRFSPPAWSPSPRLLPRCAGPLWRFGPPPQNGEELPSLPGSSTPGPQSLDLARLGRRDVVRTASHLANESLLLHLAAELAQRLFELLRGLDDYSHNPSRIQARRMGLRCKGPTRGRPVGAS